MTVAPLLEEDVLAAIEAVVSSTKSRVLVGIGDDAAVWQPSRSHRSVIASDALVEGVHFDRRYMSFDDIGWRAMASNASDLAAMGARGVLATIVLGVPSGIGIDQIESLYRGLFACARRTQIVVAGGDITRSPVLSLAITVVGEVRASNLKLRSGGKPGDVVVVTGKLGGSRAGYDVLRGATSIDARLHDGAALAHRRPSARMEEGAWLGASRNVRAMMDCSDGLSTDLARLADASGCGAVVERVPVAPAAESAARAMGVDPDEYALAGGEDFELLLTVAARAFPHLRVRFAARFGRELERVGVLRADAGVVVRKNGREEPLARSGWDHFAEAHG